MKKAAGTVKKITLELGGKAPAIVLPDADLELTIPGILMGAFFHSGQVCEAGTRLIVHDSIYDEVVERLVAMSAKIKLGNPLDRQLAWDLSFPNNKWKQSFHILSLVLKKVRD